MAAVWYYRLKGETYGPFSASQLREKAAAREITRDAWVRKGADGEWVSADRVSGLFEGSASPSPASFVSDAGEDAPVASYSRPLVGGGNVRNEQTGSKICPFCAEEIAIAAQKCKHCGEFLDGSMARSVTRPEGASRLESETTIWEGRPSGWYYLAHWMLGVVLIVGCLGLGIFLIIYAVLDQQTRRFTLTNKRVMSRKGIVSLRTDEVALADVRSINMHQGIFERLLGLGTVQIGSAGTAGIEVEFVGITNPEEVRDRIRQSKDALA